MSKGKKSSAPNPGSQQDEIERMLIEQIKRTQTKDPGLAEKQARLLQKLREDMGVEQPGDLDPPPQPNPMQPAVDALEKWWQEKKQKDQSPPPAFTTPKPPAKS